MNKQTVINWTPAKNPNPSLNLIESLYLEYVNDYLTTAAWGEAHDMDSKTAETFINNARNMHNARVRILNALPDNRNPHL